MPTPRRLTARHILRIALVAVLMPLASPLAAQTPAPSFADWLLGVRQEALADGIGEATLDAALAGLKPIPRVIELDRRQPEFTLTVQQYLTRVVSDRRVERGRALAGKHAALLEAVARKYRVQPRFIVALWGIETSYGRITGGYPVIAALATLAHDGRRSRFFRRELMHALKIIDEGHITAGSMLGSWAGAMGQSQFMPSSFHSFAVDHDGDGAKDIWSSLPDVFASIANYLSRSGWRDDQTWGRPARLPPAFPLTLAGTKIRKPLSAWQALGVRRADGRDLPTRDLPASVILPVNGARAPAWLAYHNYRVILKWNRSTYFALAVGTLSDRFGRR